MARARTVAEVIAGEAVSGTEEQRIADMRAIASVVANRAQQLGITPEQVVANSREFNAYNRSLPPGVGQQIVDLAQEQIDYVAENGPVNNATFYATPAAVDNLPSGLSYEDETTGHQYFSDPQNRAIGSALGYIQPNRYAYAQNLDVAGLPTPYSPTDLTNNSLLSAFSQTPTYSEDPFSAVLDQQAPAINQWDAMASAPPVQAPMGSVQAQGLLAANPALSANATARPMMDLAATADLGANPGLLAETAVRGLPDIATASSRMGIAEPGFDQSRFDGNSVSVASDFDPSRFATSAFDSSRFGPPSIDVATNTQSFSDQPAMAANLGSFPTGLLAQREVAQPQVAEVDTSQFDQSRFGSDLSNFDASRFGPSTAVAFDQARLGPSLVDPATNVTSFADEPAAAPASVANLGSLADAYSAQRGPTQGINSAEMQTRQGMAEIGLQKALQDKQLASFPSLNVPATGLLAANAPLAAQATVPTIQQATVPAIDNTITGSTTPGLLSPTPIASANVPLSFTAPAGVIPGQPVQQNAFVESFPSAVANNTIEPATVNDVVAAPTLENIQVSDQPAVVDQNAVVEGPATTPAEEQQAQITAPATTTAARTTPTTTTQNKGILSGLLSPEAFGGGLLGGLALGPAGGVLGALAGQQVARNGGLSGLFGGQPMSINNIGTGPAASYSVWGGGQPVGTQATASDGQRITSLPGGLIGVTNQYGVTTGFDGTGKGVAVFGSGLGQDEDPETSTSSGGLFGGLFG